MAKEILEVEARLKNFISKNLDRIEKDMKKMSGTAKKSFDKANTASARFRRHMQDAKASLISFAKQFGPAAIAIATITMAIRKMGDAIRFVREVTVRFEKTMSKIKAILTPTEKAFIGLTEKARKLGETTVFTASQVGQSFVEMGKRGFNANRIIAASAGVLDLAAAAGVDMALAASITVASLNQFALAAEESGRVVDVMTKSFNTSALDINNFAEATKMSGAVAANTGVQLEELTGHLAVLADREIKGTMAGTGMRRILLELADSTSIASKRIAEINANATTLSEKLHALKEAGVGVTEITKMFSLRGTVAAQILIANVDAADRLTETYRNAEGTAKKMAATMLDNVAGATIILKSAQEGLGIAIGEAFSDSKRERIELMTEITREWTTLIKENQEELRTMAAIISGILTLSIKVIDKIVRDFALALSLLTDPVGYFSDRVQKARIRRIEEESGWIDTLVEGAKRVTRIAFRPLDPEKLKSAFEAQQKRRKEEQNAAMLVAAAAKKRQEEAATAALEIAQKRFKAQQEEVAELEKFFSKMERHLKKIVDAEKAAQDQILESERIFRDAKISIVADDFEREREMLEAHLADREERYKGNEEAISNIKKAAELEREELTQKHAEKKVEISEKESQIIIDAAIRVANALSNLAINLANIKIAQLRREVQEGTKTQEQAEAEAKRLQNVILALAIAQSAGAAVSGIAAAMQLPFPYNLIAAAASVIEVLALAGTQIATIKSQSFARGTRNAPGGGALVADDGIELITGPTFGGLPAGSTVYNNTETRNILGTRNYNITLYGGATSADADMIIDKLLELERDGEMEDYKITMGI